MNKKAETQKRLAACIKDINRAMEAGSKEGEKRKQFFAGEIESLQQEIEAQTVRRNAAAGTNNADEFRAAAKSIATAENELNQYREALAAIDKNPAITKDQAAGFMKELAAIQREISGNATEEMAGLAAQILKVDSEAMQMQHDLIEVTQMLAGRSSGAITTGGAELRCDNITVTTIIGPTNAFPWRGMADAVKRQAGRMNIG